MSSSLKTHVISRKRQQDKSKKTEIQQESHTTNTDLLNTKTLKIMNRNCLKGTMEKVDSDETLVKPNNFNHINEVGLARVNPIPTIADTHSCV